jgi:hypothetical protein
MHHGCGSWVSLVRFGHATNVIFLHCNRLRPHDFLLPWQYVLINVHHLLISTHEKLLGLLRGLICDACH